MPHGNMVLVGLTLFVRRIIRPTLTYAILCPLWIHWKACWSLAILLWNSIVWNRLKMVVRYSEFPLEHGDFASCHLWTTILPLECEIAIGFTTWIWGVPLLIGYRMAKRSKQSNMAQEWQPIVVLGEPWVSHGFTTFRSFAGRKTIEVWVSRLESPTVPAWQLAFLFKCWEHLRKSL